MHDLARRLSSAFGIDDGSHELDDRVHKLMSQLGTFADKDL